jgi:hypothetical protein
MPSRAGERMGLILDRTTHDESPAPDDVRLALKPVTAAPGPLDGAWWPRSRDLAAELSALTAAPDAPWGRIARVAVNPHFWPVVPRRTAVAGHVVPVDWFTAGQDPHKLLLLSRDTGRWDLLVIPPETDSGAAARLLSAAADPRITATAGALLAVERLHGAGST